MRQRGGPGSRDHAYTYACNQRETQREAAFVAPTPAARPARCEVARSAFLGAPAPRSACSCWLSYGRRRRVHSRAYPAAAAQQAGDGDGPFRAPSEEAAPKRIAVVGAGWAGLACAYELSKRRGVEVTLVEGSTALGGLASGWRTAQGRSVEAGVHGFWRQYHNIFRLVGELGIQPFTGKVEQGFYGLRGLEAVWPVFGELPALPAPLGSFAYVKYETVPLADRLSAWPLVAPLLDFDGSDAAWRRYDQLSARDLFRPLGVSPRLYEEARAPPGPPRAGASGGQVLDPMLLLGLFAPGEACSAAAALAMSAFFILDRHDAFDVRYARGPIAELVFRPLLAAVEARGGRALLGTRVADVLLDGGGRARGLACEGAFAGLLECEAVVFAVGVPAMQRIVAASPALRARADFRAVANLRAIDALAMRLWFDRRVHVPRAANACRHPDPTTSWTFFDLTELHDEYRGGPQTVLECDFYHADQLLALDDAAAAGHAEEGLRRLLPSLRGARLADAAVVRLPRAVSHFSPGSYQHLLPGRTSLPNVFAAGDWIRREDGMDEAWSQERACATGVRAAAAALEAVGAAGSRPAVLPVEPEAHLTAARALAARLRSAAPFPLPGPFPF